MAPHNQVPSTNFERTFRLHKFKLFLKLSKHFKQAPAVRHPPCSIFLILKISFSSIFSARGFLVFGFLNQKAVSCDF